MKHAQFAKDCHTLFDELHKENKNDKLVVKLIIEMTAAAAAIRDVEPTSTCFRMALLSMIGSSLEFEEEEPPHAQSNETPPVLHS